MGAAVAQLVLTEGEFEARAAVLISPVVQLVAMVDAMSRHFDVTYEWTDAALEVASRLDFLARADEIAERDQPAILCVVGEDDDAPGFRAPAMRLRDELAARYDDPTRVAVHVVPGMAHALAEEPGVEPAPQTAHAKTVDALAVDWFRRHLPA